MRLPLIAAIVALTLGLTATTAHAGSAYSGTGYHSVSGRNFTSIAGIHTTPSNHKVYATSAMNHSSGNLPAGWLGALPRRHSGTGALQCTGSWVYTNGNQSAVSAVGCTSYAAGTYQARGQVRGWNSTTNSYSTWNTNTSPNQNA